MIRTGKGRVAGVVGWPIAHSLSPLLHGFWLDEYDIDGALVPLAVATQDFARVLDGLRRAGFRGVNVTVPHKQAAFALAHSLDAHARNAGSVNLLVFRDDTSMQGRNTDCTGLAESLRESAIADLRDKTVVLLGAGGAARAAILALDMLGAAKIHILNRSAARAQLLAASLAPHVGARLFFDELTNWSRYGPEAQLLINCTSLGMRGNQGLDIDLSCLAQSATVCDIVYNPLQTQLLSEAARRGHPTIDGLGMLMHQAVPAFEAFFGVRPKVTKKLRDRLVKVLDERQP